MSYSEFKDGYAIEGSFKDGTTLNDQTDIAYLLGQLASRNDWPDPVYEVIHTATGVNAKEVGAGLLFKSRARMEGMISLMVQDGVLIKLAMGKSTTTTDNGAPYTHAIGPTTDGTQLPSIVLQHEEKGDATDEEYQYQGVKIDSMVLSHDSNGPDFLMAKLEIKAAFALDPAFALDDDPALPATANPDPFLSYVRKWNTTDPAAGTSIAGLEKIEIIVANGLTPIYGHSHDTGTYTGQWPYMFTEARKKAYRINLLMHPNTIERQLWDELLARGNTKDAVFKWTRGADDYIKVTALDCQVVSVPKHTPESDKLNLEEVVLVPRALSFEVKDAIAGGAYGE